MTKKIFLIFGYFIIFNYIYNVKGRVVRNTCLGGSLNLRYPPKRYHKTIKERR